TYQKLRKLSPVKPYVTPLQNRERWIQPPDPLFFPSTEGLVFCPNKHMASHRSHFLPQMLYNQERFGLPTHHAHSLRSIIYRYEAPMPCRPDFEVLLQKCVLHFHRG